ncbi:MAG: hypothetical protein ABH830_02415 [Patescibacteria group bacterium]
MGAKLLLNLKEEKLSKKSRNKINNKKERGHAEKTNEQVIIYVLTTKDDQPATFRTQGLKQLAVDFARANNIGGKLDIRVGKSPPYGCKLITYGDLVKYR